MHWANSFAGHPSISHGGVRVCSSEQPRSDLRGGKKVTEVQCFSSAKSSRVSSQLGIQVGKRTTGVLVQLHYVALKAL
jgi:isopentenyldiphosphate isomerase